MMVDSAPGHEDESCQRIPEGVPDSLIKILPYEARVSSNALSLFTNTETDIAEHSDEYRACWGTTKEY